MREFFGRFLGGGRSPEVPREVPPPQEARAEDPYAALREKKFREALTALTGEEVSDERFELAKREISGGTKDLPPLTAEEMQIKARGVVEQFGWTPEAVPAEEVDEYEPMSDSYTGMGIRRKNFEEAFAQHLGRPVTQEDIDEARGIFESDSNIQKRWSQLIGEEVVAYAKRVAEILEDPYLHADNNDTEGRIAAK